METDRESDLNESSLADMEEDSGSSYEINLYRKRFY